MDATSSSDVGVHLVAAAGLVAHLSWKGEVDLASAAALKEELASLPECSVTLDLGKVTFLDSSGLALLVELRERVLAADGHLQLLNVPPQVRRVMQITGLDRVLDATEMSTPPRVAPADGSTQS